MDAPVVNPPTPYTTLIPGGFFPGKMIRIQGFVPMHAQRFDINLQTGAGGEIAGEDVAIHASVRLSEGYVARNSFQGNCWQEELGEGGLPILPGQRFELLLLSESYEYKIAVNGQHFCSFPPRVPYSRITHLMIEGDVQIELIAWEGSSASAPPPQYGSAVPPPQYTPQQTFMQQAAPNPPPGAVMTKIYDNPWRWYGKNQKFAIVIFLVIAVVMISLFAYFVYQSRKSFGETAKGHLQELEETAKGRREELDRRLDEFGESAKGLGEKFGRNLQESANGLGEKFDNKFNSGFSNHNEINSGFSNDNEINSGFSNDNEINSGFSINNKINSGSSYHIKINSGLFNNVLFNQQIQG